jgi:hypothetical protein
MTMESILVTGDVEWVLTHMQRHIIFHRIIRLYQTVQVYTILTMVR